MFLLRVKILFIFGSFLVLHFVNRNILTVQMLWINLSQYVGCKGDGNHQMRYSALFTVIRGMSKTMKNYYTWFMYDPKYAKK